MFRVKLKAIPLCLGLREALNAYTFKDFLSDSGAAFVVSLVALPLSMALAIAVGLAPQHGLYTAIIGGIVAAIFGGSRFQVSGPTAAFVVILIPIVADFGLRGIIWCQIIAGCILLLFALAKLGRLIRYVPYPVTTGFTTGIALVLFVIALKDFLGISTEAPSTHFIYKLQNLFQHLTQINPFELVVGFATLLTVIYGRRFINFIPSSAIGVAVGIGMSLILAKAGIDIHTISSQFTYVDATGALKHGIPSVLPILQLPNLEPNHLLSLPNMLELQAYIGPALVIASLAALESLLSASIADSLTGTRHHPNGELCGIGLANIFSGLASGIPATAAIARTATNISNGAKSPISVILHSLLLLTYMVLLSPLICLIPLTSLAALLMVTAYNMSHVHQFKAIVKTAPNSDKIVLFCCFALTVLVDMVAGVLTGIVLASFLFMKRIAELTQIEINEPESASTTEDDALSTPLDVIIFRVDGPLFFGTVEKAYDRTTILKDHSKTIIIDLVKVPLVDATGLVAIHSVLNSITSSKDVILCGNHRVIDKILLSRPQALQARILCFATVHDALTHLRTHENPISVNEDIVAA